MPKKSKSEKSNFCLRTNFCLRWPIDITVFQYLFFLLDAEENNIFENKSSPKLKFQNCLLLLEGHVATWN